MVPCPSRHGARSKAPWPKASCVRLYAPPALISASTGAMSTASFRWARQRALRACCNALAGQTTAWTNPARPFSCRVTASNIWKHRPPLTPLPKGCATAKPSTSAAMMCLRSMSWASPVRGHLTKPNCWQRCNRPCLIPPSTPPPLRVSSPLSQRADMR